MFTLLIRYPQFVVSVTIFDCYKTNAVMKAKIDTYLTFNGKQALVVGKNCERIETKKMWQMCMQCKHLH